MFFLYKREKLKLYLFEVMVDAYVLTFNNFFKSKRPSLGNYNLENLRSKSMRNIRNSLIVLAGFRRLIEIFWLSRMLPLNIIEENKFS